MADESINQKAATETHARAMSRHLAEAQGALNKAFEKAVTKVGDHIRPAFTMLAGMEIALSDRGDADHASEAVYCSLRSLDNALHELANMKHLTDVVSARLTAAHVLIDEIEKTEHKKNMERPSAALVGENRALERLVDEMALAISRMRAANGCSEFERGRRSQIIGDLSADAVDRIRKVSSVCGR